MKSKQYVLLDFCGTVVDFQTFDPFIYYILKIKKPGAYRYFNSSIVKLEYKVLERMCFLNKNKHPLKERLIREIKGIPLEIVNSIAEDYYTNIIRPHFIHEVIELMLSLKEEGKTIILVSAACDSYLKYFAREFGIDTVIATKLAFDSNDIALGMIEGKDIVGTNKVEALKIYLGDSFKDCFFEVGITDSITDMPMLEMCKRKIVISHKKNQEWAKKMEEVIWA